MPHGARRTTHDARRTAHGARRTAHGARRTAHGARRTAHDARRTAHDARRTAHGARRTAHDARRTAQTHGARRTTHGARRTTHDARRTPHAARRAPANRLWRDAIADSRQQIEAYIGGMNHLSCDLGMCRRRTGWRSSARRQCALLPRTSHRSDSATHARPKRPADTATFRQTIHDRDKVEPSRTAPKARPHRRTVR